MLDEKIVDLYWARSEEAISETSKKYGALCHSIAYNILHSDEDAKECVNDTYFNAWNSMPTHRPNILSAFLGKITRNLALTRYKHNTTKSRGGGQIAVAIDELSECVSGVESADDVVNRLIFEDLINGFLDGLSKESRDIFISRYWFLYAPAEIAEAYHISESKVNTSLHRMRKALKCVLEREGVF